MKTWDRNMVNDEELAMLLDQLFQACGYDFSNYARASLKRRVNRLMVVDRHPSFAELLFSLKNNESYLKNVVEHLTVNVTDMFRDPNVFRMIREEIIPQLATYPVIRVWHAGCATGEEVYSMAILLAEAGLLKKSLIYATDINPTVIENIRKGIFPLSSMKQFSENYILSGGQKDFSQYYTANYNWAKFDDSLREKMIPATHNLVSDRSFNEFQVIFCRNVLIYFDKELQDKVLTLFDESLQSRGFLVLGSKENLMFSPIANKYKALSQKEKIWRKLR